MSPLRGLSGRPNMTGDNHAVSFVVHGPGTTEGWIEIDGRNQRFYVYRKRDTISVWIGGRTYHLTRGQKGQATADTNPAGGSGEIRTVMPGKILRIAVSLGET